MTEFFNKILQWFSENSNTILAFLTPANLALLIGSVVGIFRQKKTIVKHTYSSDNLAKSMGDFKALTKQTDNLKDEITSLKALVGDLRDQSNQSHIKLNSILDVQQTAYNATEQFNKDTRNNINNAIANGKFAESNSRRVVEEEVTRLNQIIAELTGKLNAASVTADKNIKKATSGAGSGVRYD